MNIMDVNVETVETSSVDMTSAFKWEQDVNPGIGSLTLDATGQNVQMYGNEEDAGKMPFGYLKFKKENKNSHLAILLTLAIVLMVPECL